LGPHPPNIPHPKKIMKSYLKSSVLPAIFCLLGAYTYAAESPLKYPIKWDEKPALHPLSDSLKKEAAVYILEQRQIEFVENKDSYDMYRTVHHLIHLNDEKGVEAFNTFSIPSGSDRKLVEVKARTILPGGRIIEVPSDKVKEVKNEDNEPEYKIAMEGVEQGAEVELIYTEELSLQTSGWEVFFFGVPALTGTFRMIVPEHLKFDSKGFNGFSGFTDSVANKFHFYSSAGYNIPKLEDETYSRFRPNLERIDYKLSYTAADGTVRHYTWADLAKKLYERYYGFTDKEMRIVQNTLDNIGIRLEDKEEKKIIAIEDYLKTNILMSDKLTDDNVEAFKEIESKKLTTEKGFVRFFVACLSAAGVQHELGLVSGRYSYQMDESIEMWDHLSLFAIYFPKLQSYISPSAVNFRYPFFPYMMGGATGIFCKTTSFGTVTSALPDIRTIPHLPMNRNQNSITSEVKFSSPDMVPDIKVTLAFKGYNSSGIRELFLYGNKDKEREEIMALTGITDKITDIVSSSVEDADLKNFTVEKPLKINVEVQPPQLMEKAGPKYLFKVGQIIGKQVEMYQDEHRALPIEIEYMHSLPRVIKIIIPDGYKISNPEVVRMKVMFHQGDKDLCGFTSDYTLDGRVMTINVNEFYDAISYPISSYEPFRKVINASADFSKATLILQKI